MKEHQKRGRNRKKRQLLLYADDAVLTSEQKDKMKALMDEFGSAFNGV